ncbi:GL17531 [Drosophila persimilis]|uniref:GL17531 n=1 Tax=Drosophila persimilis TaxID=7234 RepID=B4HC91_DROPE|nr:protein cup [Drosophila persimilis]EDW25266.1 GL17531 [Drosophila persimilis]
MDIRKDQARYSRADLLALRYEGSSRQRPQCANRNELQTLNFWKVNASANVPSNYANPNKISLSPETDNSSLSSSNNGLISSRRAMRNRERANNYYQRFAPSDSHSMCIEDKDKDTQSTQSVLGGPPFKSSIIDHRSISSSHLMPAFAKRRFAVVNCGNGTENEPINTNCDDIAVGENVTVELDHTHVSTPTHNQSQSKGMSSPIRKASEWGESCERRSNNVQQDHDQSLASSPTFSTTRQERRIGSGRLLPRADNWDYKGQQQSSSGIEKEKERSQNGSGSINQQNQSQNQNQQRPRTFSGRHGDRLTEHIGDRRFQYDNKRSVDRQGVSSRRSSNKDSGCIQGRGKRTNMYHQHDRHEEPEWFSAGPTSQLETIDLHGFDDHDHNDERSEFEDKANRFPSKPSQLAEPIVVDGASTSSSMSSLNVVDVKTKDDNKDTGESVIQPQLEPTQQSKNHQQSGRLPCTSNSEGEFNFDAFLNMHPLDPTLMSNDGDEQDETKGTSRFSRWFRPKEAANNNEPSGLRESGAQETHDIPSVKDLEAQMTKVNLRSEYTNPIAVAYGGQQAQVEKPVARDTEAFRKLLQQLGSQSNQHQLGNDVYHMINTSNAHQCANQNTHRPHLIDPQQNILRDHSPQIKEEDTELFQQRFKHSDCMPKRINEAMVQQQHTIQGVHTPNIALAQKRMEVHHLIQGIARGDVSVEFLEKELSNPSTVPHTKDVIATVLREYSSSRRNSLAYKPAYPNEMDHHSLAHLSFHQAQPQHQNYSDDLFPQNSSNHGISQHIRHSNSPTPLAFTPTSVLRKMTADKDTPYNQTHQQYQMHPQNTKLLAPNPIGNEPQAMSAQPRMILGGGNYSISPNSPQMSPKLQQSRNLPPMKWAHGTVQMPQGKSFGRPILKGSLNTVPHQLTAVPFGSKAELQQQQHQLQQRFKPMQPTDSVLNTENVNQNIPYSDGISQMQHHHYLQLQQQSHQPLRHRVIHGAQISSSIPACPDISESGNLIKSNYHRDDRLPSPTNNQLAQWFSPELLARASAGKLPLLNMNQTLSLEEFERSIQHSSAVVHN